MVASLALTSLDARAASFDCKKAATAIEKLTCSDAGLSELDGKLADAYRRALAIVAHPDALKAEQRTWLTAERAKCADVACLREAYQRRIIALGNAADAGFVAPAGNDSSYSFVSAPFVNPRLVEDLTVGESDHGDQVLAVNVSDSQRSNRYFGDAEVRRDARTSPYIFYRNDGEEFGYRHIGRTTSGVDVLLTTSSAGGSGVFMGLMLVTLRLENSGMSPDLGLDNGTVSFKRKRLVLRKLGAIGLTDRWQGELAVRGNEIVIGNNVTPLPGDDSGERRIIKVEFP